MIKKKNQKAKKTSESKHTTKMGKGGSDIFGMPTQPVIKNEITIPIIEEVPAPVSENTEQKTKLPRGRPQEHTESMTKVTVILLDRQRDWLDQLALNIRTKTKASISRAEILRAMVSAIEDSGIDLSETRNESEARQLILSFIKR